MGFGSWLGNYFGSYFGRYFGSSFGYSFGLYLGNSLGSSFGSYFGFYFGYYLGFSLSIYLSGSSGAINCLTVLLPFIGLSWLILRHFLAILISSTTIALMQISPIFSTEIAKMMSAHACHMIASYFLLKHHPTFPVSLVLIIILHEICVVLVAASRVNWEEAFLAELDLADWTL